ncbi:response regulator [Oceaniglobus indicus]|uniref:response regulator n=1 Tax=Oceaniglobus indicus TaxID=2047749 RepID=UPI000C19CAD9|nr:response regulator [Oceaniglobus indicus]
MPEMREEFLFPFKPTQDRPLLGQTVLIVEDSRFASEGVRLMCLRFGARIRRADTLAAAGRHLTTYRPTIALIDLGLPDGSGETLIREMAEARPRVPVLLATSGDAAMGPRAIAAGADAFLEKPLTAVGAFLETIMARLPRDLHPSGPRPLLNDVVVPDTMALRDDLAHISDLLAGDDIRVDYIVGFLTGLGRSIGDHALARAAGHLAALQRDGQPTAQQLSHVSAMIARKLNDRSLAS